MTDIIAKPDIRKPENLVYKRTDLMGNTTLMKFR